MKKIKKIFIVVNVDWAFLSHRLELGLGLLKKGHNVTIIGIEERMMGEKIRSHGFDFIPLPSTRSGKNIFIEISTILFLYKTYKKEKPDIIHHVTLKPVIYGSLACKFLNINKVINAITGLGTVFIDKKNNLITFLIIRFLLWFAFRKNNLDFIFQNQTDMEIFTDLNIADKKKFNLIPGAGVDLKKFSYSKDPKNKKLMVLLPARMLKDKGIYEFKNAVYSLSKSIQKKTEFILAGDIDSFNKTSLNIKELKKWNNEGIVKWIGHQKNMNLLMRKSNIVVLPSYLEGLPKSLIEASSSGRPIITTDVPGCRDVVEHNVNGVLVKVRDYVELSKAIKKLLSERNTRIQMGIEGRKKAEDIFSNERINKLTYEIYSLDK